jgi:hypothetical protein
MTAGSGAGERVDLDGGLFGPLWTAGALPGPDHTGRVVDVGDHNIYCGCRPRAGTRPLAVAWLGTAVLVRASDQDKARAVLTPDRYADIEVHDWAFGGRSS